VDVVAGTAGVLACRLHLRRLEGNQQARTPAVPDAPNSISVLLKVDE
jgi:hypothetical protein